MLNCLAASFIRLVSLLTTSEMLTTFQAVHLQELVFCAAGCSQANRLVEVKGLLNEAEIAVSSRGQLNSCSSVVIAHYARTGRSSGNLYGSNLLLRLEMLASKGGECRKHRLYRIV